MTVLQTAPLSRSGILTCGCGRRIRTCVRLLTGPAYETGELGHCSIPRFCRSRRARTSDLRFWRPTFYQLNYAPIVEVEGLEPTKPNGGRFTVCSRCRWRTPHYILVEPRGVEPRSQDFQSCAYTKSAKVPSEEAKGFEPLGRLTALWFSRLVQ